jgi:hypothetical protein
MVRILSLRRFFALSALSALLVGSTLGAGRLGPVHAAAVPSGLPTHFAIGLGAAPDNTGIYGWMPSSGIPWDYAYQYLAGGVNTGVGWETWNTQGEFALNYAQGAASHNYIPVFSYYEMAQSNGNCGSCGEAQRDLSNLNNVSTMKSYFANFRTLMQRIGSGTYAGIAGFGKTAIVHVEPDLSGYAEQAVLNSATCYGFCTGTGNNPTFLKASVAGSGDADVTAFPNTYQGFNWALLHIRDLYAPNVRLAFHVSNWAAGSDVGSDTSSTLNAAALGQTIGSFAAQSGISGLPTGVNGYDLLFNDVSDRDAGYYKYVYGASSAFWDRNNVTFPNFHRWETFISAASTAAGRPVIAWQVPEGNQYFDTENNTDGHYQDNRAEYFFGHIAELVQAGVIGVLFGAGNGGSTEQFDGMSDGITNPSSICTSDGISSGQVCNTHTSTVSDDDGGYIRMEGGQYYAAGGYPLSGTVQPTATSTPKATATTGPTSVPATKTATVRPSATPSLTPVRPTNTATVMPSATASLTPIRPTNTSTAKPTSTSSPTAVPPTSTTTPLRTATSAPSATPSGVLTFHDTASLSPAAPSRGASTTLSVQITATNGSLNNGVVDMEIYNSANWTKVGQYSVSAQNLSAGQTGTYRYTWAVPNSAGHYTVMVGVFGATWAPNYFWDSAAAQLVVQ